MGGFSLGELSGVLRLDDSDYRQKIADSAAATALIRAKIDDTVTTIQVLGKRLREAGFDSKEFQSAVRSLNAQTRDVNVTFETLLETIRRVRSEIIKVHGDMRSQLPGLQSPETIAGVAAKGRVTESFAAQWAELQKDLAFASDKIKKQIDADAAKRQKEIFGQVNSEITERLRVEKVEKESRERIEKAAKESRERLDTDARARSDEMRRRIEGDMAFTARKVQEEADAVRRAQQAAQERERQQYIEHRRQMQKASAFTTVGITASAIGGAGLAGEGVVAKDAAGFQDAMAKSLTVIGDLATTTRDRMAQAARDAAKETGLAAKDIASNYAIAAKGGLDAAQSLEFVPKAAKFAVATNSELHESTRQIITIMEALQLPASQAGKVMDELTVANQIARGSVDQLATALEGKAGAALRAAHVSLEEALALTVAFSRAGVTASQSQTFLTQVIERLLYAARQYGNEIVQVGDKQMKFKDIVYLSDGSVRPFVQTLKLLDEAFKGRSSAAIGKFFDDIHLGSARGAQALKILLSQSESLDLLTGKFGEVGGAMQHAFDQQMQSPLRQLARLKAQIVDIAITIGIPTVASLQSFAKSLEPLLHGIQTLAAKFSELPQWFQQFITMSGLAGAGALVFGGGLLVLSGHIVRLAADIKLLMGAEAFSGLIPTLTTVASKFGVIGITIASLIGFITTLKAISDKEVETAKVVQKAQTIPNPRGGPDLEIPSTGGTVAMLSHSTKGKEAGKATGDGYTEGLRQALEKLKEVYKEALNPGDFAVNPEKVLKEKLTTEKVRQAFSAFSNEYNQLVDRLTTNEQEAIAQGAQRVGKLLASGADPRVVMSALQALDQDLKRYKSDAAERDRQETKSHQQKAAAEAVAAFKERYFADLTTFSQEQKDRIEEGIRSLEDGLSKGIDPKVIAEDLKLVERAWQSINDEVKDVNKTENILASTERKYEAAERRALQRRQPGVKDPESHLPDGLRERFFAVEPSIKEGRRLEEALRSIGVVSQFALNQSRDAAAALYLGIKNQLKPSVDELREAWIHAREAEIRAEEGLKPFHDEIARVRTEIARLTAEGRQNDRILHLESLQIQMKAIDWALNGIGKTGKNILGELSSGWNQLGSTIVRSFRHIEDFGKIWKDTLGNILEGTMTSLIQGLLNSFAGWVLKTLGLSKVLGLGQIQTAAAIGEANAMAATAMIPIVGPALALGVGEAMYAAILATSLPKIAMFEQGGFVDKTQMALVHGGEFVATAKLTKGLQALVEGGTAGGGGGDHFDFRGAHFGAGLTAGSLEAMMRPVVSKLRRSGGRARTGRF